MTDVCTLRLLTPRTMRMGNRNYRLLPGTYLLEASRHGCASAPRVQLRVLTTVGKQEGTDSANYLTDPANEVSGALGSCRAIG